MNVFNFLNLDELIEVADIGASAINEEPPYKILLRKELARLTAFDGDARQTQGMKKTFGEKVTILNDFLFDGTEQTVFIASPASGMTSLLVPDLRSLSFFSGFSSFGTVHKEVKTATKRLDDVAGVPLIDFIKMDVQGAELTILKNGVDRLKNCVAIQLEVSFVPLYKSQPPFGEVDLYLRSQGFIPHSFADIKRWVIAPTIFQNDFRKPGNQLLEADAVYIKDPLSVDKYSDAQLMKLAAISHFCFRSFDLCVHLLIELEKRKLIEKNAHQRYLSIPHRF